jgi:hypothetical protein
MKSQIQIKKPEKKLKNDRESLILATVGRYNEMKTDDEKFLSPQMAIA